MAAQNRKSQLEMSRDEMEESNDVLCNLETLPASSQGTRSGSICSTSIKAQYLRDSPKLSRSSISRDTMDRRGNFEKLPQNAAEIENSVNCWRGYP